MRIIQLGYGRFGKIIAKEFPSKYDTLYVSDKTFTKDNLPKSFLPNVIYEPFTSVGELHHKILPSAYYLAIPHECQIDILRQIPHEKLGNLAVRYNIPVLVEKPAIGNCSRIESVKTIRPLNTVAVGHTFLQCSGYQYVRNQLCASKLPTCIYAERINTNGPIRTTIDAKSDLAIHDVSLFWDLLKHRYKNVDNWDVLYNATEIECRLLYANKFACRFMLGYNNTFIDINTSWIGPQKKRSWHVNFDNETLYWDAIKDTVFSHINGPLAEPDRFMPLQHQWNYLLGWAKDGGNCPSALHNLEDALVIQYLLEQI
jgi:hypothetical protein